MGLSRFVYVLVLYFFFFQVFNQFVLDFNFYYGYVIFFFLHVATVSHAKVYTEDCSDDER